MIDGIKIKKLKFIRDRRGRLAEILRKDDDFFKKFGQAYVTTAKPKAVKAWHYHKKQTDNFFCIFGRMRVGLYDARPKSATFGKAQEVIMSFDKPVLFSIPSGISHGFECISKNEAAIINFCTDLYDYKKPDEYRTDPFNNDIPFKWRGKFGG